MSFDTLNLHSVFGRVRNPYGARRWGFWEQSPAKTMPGPVRITQELMVAGQNYGVDNLAPTMFAPDPNTRVYQSLAGQDWWTRPAARWFPVNVIPFGTGVLLVAVTGNPFVLIDPVNPSVQISAQIGDDVLVDVAGTRYAVKIVDFQPNTVFVQARPGSSLPPAATNVYAYHRIDGHLLEVTTSWVVPNSELTPLRVRSGIRLVYYTAGTPVHQDYSAIPIRSLAGNPTFVVTPVVGDRFGAINTTAYSRVTELIQAAVARVPDEVRLFFTVTSGRFAQPAVHHGDMVNVSVPVVTNLLAAAPAATVDQQQLEPVDPVDGYTATGDVVMVSAGQQCPPGYENIAQVDSGYNPNFVRWESGALNGQVAAIPFTLSVVSNVSTFTGQLPHGTPSQHSLAGPQNNSATYELLVIRSGKRFAYRIPRVQFAVNGTITFQVPADLRFLIDQAPDIVRGYLYRSGLLRRSSLSEAGLYRKPSVSDVNIEMVQWSFADEGPSTPSGPASALRGLTLASQDGFAWLDRVAIPNPELFQVNDLLRFVDANGSLLTPPTADRFLSSAVARNLAPLIAGLPFGPVFRVSAVDVAQGYLELVNPDGSQTDVTGYVIDFNSGAGAPYDTSPPTNRENFYEIERGSVEHNHLITTSENQAIKPYNPGGHWVSKVDHYHTMAAQEVVPPYVKMILCARL